MIVYFAVILTVLLGFCGLAVDTARMELRQDQLQAAADTGALAAAGELSHSGTGSNYQTAANTDVAAYETANNIPSTGNPIVQTGATYGPYVGDHSTVQVTVTQNLGTIFLGLLSSGSASMTLTAKAVAQMPPCMVFLGNPTVSSTYDYYGSSAGQDTPNYACPEYFKDGLVIDYFARVGGSQIRSSGPASASYIGGTTTWTPVYSVPPIADPLAYVQLPTVGTCIANVSALNQASSATITLAPGTYCGKTNATPTYVPGPGAACGQTATRTTPAVDIEGTWAGCPTQGGTNGNDCTTRPTVNLSPGLYVFVGGANFTCATVNGTGVTMYFTKNTTVGYGLFHVISTAWNVSAPNVTNTGSGTIAGIEIMNDPAWIGGTQDIQMVYSTWYGDGIVYLRGTGLDAYALNMSAPNYLNIVASNMYTYDAEVRPSVNYANLPAGNPLRTAVSLVQ
jgi:Flp pilus assembly protein TadG